MPRERCRPMALEMPSMRSGPVAQKILRAKRRPEAHKMPRVECRVGARKLPSTRRRPGPCVTSGVINCQKPLEKPPARRRSGSCGTPCTRHNLRRTRIHAQDAACVCTRHYNTLHAGCRTRLVARETLAQTRKKARGRRWQAAHKTPRTRKWLGEQGKLRLRRC